jgi:hypothetical protein
MSDRTNRVLFVAPRRHLGDLGALAFHARRRALRVRFARLALLAILAVPALAPAGESPLERARKRAAERDILLERELCGTSLKAALGGPAVTGDDLPGRTVLVIIGGPDNAKWNEFMVRMGMQYIKAAPPGGVLPLFVQGKATSCTWWTAGGGSPLVSFFTEDAVAMPGLTFTGGPRYILFDGDGKLVGDICHDGRDLTGGSVHLYAGTRLTPDLVAKTVEATSGSVVKAGEYRECAEDARRLAEAAAVSAPIAPVVTALKAKAKDGKGGARAEAAALLAGLREYYEKQAALVERNLAVHPFLALRTARRCAAQTQGDAELGPRFARLRDRLASDAALQAELKPAELLYAARAQAALIQWGLLDPDEPPRPKEQVQAVKRGLEEILRSHPRSRAAQAAAELKKAYTEWAAKAIDPSPW